MSMKNKRREALRKICLWSGVALLVAGVAVLFFWQCSIGVSQQRAESYVEMLRAAMPEAQGAYLEERRDNTMSVFSLEGIDFTGILEMPQHNSALPVCAAWDSAKYPCRFSGSIYDGTVQIGATSQKGQYDFYREISVGDGVFFTDMEGNRYAYTVTDLRYEKHADQTALQKEDADLTLFVKNIYGFDYIVIFCDILL